MGLTCSWLSLVDSLNTLVTFIIVNVLSSLMSHQCFFINADISIIEGEITYMYMDKFIKNTKWTNFYYWRRNMLTDK